MNNISINISGRIDPERVTLLRDIKEVADDLAIHFFVVGAFARDLNFEHIHHIPAPRVTEDIDIGVEVADWETFRYLTDSLIDRDILKPTKSAHRFTGNSPAIVVDIIPYGGISNELKKISWPPDHRIIMSMLGFEEAFQSAMAVCLETEPLLEILVPSVPALTVMKIISWNDAYPNRNRDARDILFILENYHVIVSEYLYEPPAVLLEEEAFDLCLASVRLLGRKIAQLCSKITKETIVIILDRESEENGEVKMLSQMGSAGSFQTKQFENSLKLLKKLLQGIREETTKV